MAGVEASHSGMELQISNDSTKRRTYSNSASSPVRGPDKYWVNSVANTVQKAIANDPPSSEMNNGSFEDESLAVLTKKIARQVTNNIPKDTIMALINEAKGLIKVFEASCHERNSEDEDSENSSDYRNESPRAIDHHMNEIVSKKIPNELSKWIARELYIRLMASGEDIDSSDNDDDDVPPDVWRSARASFDVRNEAVMAKIWSPEKTTEGGQAPPVNNSSTHSMGPSVSASSQRGERVFITDDLKQRSQAFKKFKQVLGSGTGFRVIKHNHNGGRKTRVLKYNIARNRLHWESARMLGGEQISCSRIGKVDRDVTTVYVWYYTGGRHGSVKKMVGFETQREADAQILELALLYLKDRGSHTRT
mmetsp:Transcript_7669/g.11526  ORF Transcript_7669/g.11526 Transcript_7669/m.11526 type:complete len:364 (+) Transcript_7669:84-1175(+)|eukprot:CAMPEP_0171461644 /NCGR_PEP_ID=MMETSP0945-20130129/6005_1 /TAXON_ID=109269 /ORGANISM="Vaucheria litorea, Strain CCMP2940" /LENGTH=363 /DNA_ID=CAMNT_0011988023 /DNA_START=84 /DNA_END=1175 /DNA_ORIENTATION=+